MSDLPHGRDEAVNPYEDDTACWCPDDWREPFDKALCPQHGGAVYESERSERWREGFAAARAAFDAVVAERDRLASECAVCEKCGHVQAEPNWCHECGHRTTPPEWAKPLLDAWHEREGDKHLARPATEKLVSLTREGEEWAAGQALHDLGRVKAAEGRRLSRLEDALKHLREFVQDGEVRRIIDAALDGRDWNDTE